MSGLHMLNLFNVWFVCFDQTVPNLKHSKVEPDIVQILIHGVVHFTSPHMILPKFEECRAQRSFVAKKLIIFVI